MNIPLFYLAAAAVGATLITARVPLKSRQSSIRCKPFPASLFPLVLVISLDQGANKDAGVVARSNAAEDTSVNGL